MKATLAIALALVLPAAAGAQEQPTFEETTTVVLVEIPVNVVRDNQPVRGLVAADFEVFEGRQQRELSGFEVIDLILPQALPPGVEPARKEPPVAGRRHFLLFFDLSHTRPEVLVLAVRGARDLVRSGLHPTDLVGVAVASVDHGVDLVLGFTPDRRQVGKVLDALDRLLDRDQEALAEAPPGGSADPLGLVAGGVPALAAQIGRTAGWEISPAGEALEWGNLGGRGGAFLGETLLEMEVDQQQVVRARRRSAAAALAASVGDFARLTSGIEGRKFLIFLGEGFDLRLLGVEPERRPGMIGAGASGSRTLRDLNQMVDQLRRAGWTVQSVYPGKLHHDRTSAGEDSLTMIAHGTGGELYENFNDLSVAMERMLDTTSVTYLLSFYASDVAIDGSFHPLRIELKDGPSGTRLLHPPGYYAPKPAAEQNVIETTLETAERILSGDDGGELEVAALVAPFKGPEAARVSVWIETSGVPLVTDPRGERLAVEVFGYALDAGREIHGFFRQEIDIELNRVRSRLERGALKFLSELELEPGSYDLRLLVREVSGRYGLRTVPVIVPDLSRSQPALLPPMVLDGPGHGVVVRQAKAGESLAEARQRYPFKIDDKPFVPAVHPALPPGQQARICLMAYHLDPQEMVFSTAITRPDGTRVWGDRLQIVARSEPAPDGLSQLYFELDPEGLEPGDYTMEITITDLRTDATRSQSAAFRVVGQELGG